MGTIVIYKKPTRAELDKGVDAAVEQITTWFKHNPKRKVCKANIWHGTLYKIRRAHIIGDVYEAASKIETID